MLFKSIGHNLEQKRTKFVKFHKMGLLSQAYPNLSIFDEKTAIFDLQKKRPKKGQKVPKTPQNHHFRGSKGGPPKNRQKGAKTPQKGGKRG